MLPEHIKLSITKCTPDDPSNIFPEQPETPQLVTTSTMSRPPKTTISIDVPEGWLIGLDLCYFNSTRQFKGIKLVPDGLHLLHWGQDDQSVRSGIFFEAREEEVLCFKWNVQEERMDTTFDGLDIAECLSMVPDDYPYMANFGDLKSKETGADSSTKTDDFSKLIKYVTPSIVKQVTQGKIVSSTTATSQEASVLREALKQSAANRAHRNASENGSHSMPAEESENVTPGFTEQDVGLHEAQLHFLKIDTSHTWRPGATGRERTLDLLDTTWYIGNVLLKEVSTPNNLLGNLQLSFLLLLVLSNYSASITWRDIVKVLCKGEEASGKYPDLYVQFLDVLELQLSTAPAEYIEGLLEVPSLVDSFSNLKEIVVEGQRGFNNTDEKPSPLLARKMSALESLLEKMGYHLEQPQDED